MRVNDVSLYFDVDAASQAPRGDAMCERPTMLLLHGGPGADHSLFKPEFADLRDVAQIIYPLARDAAHRYLTGDTSDEAATAWEAHAVPLYGDPRPKPTWRSAALVRV